MSKRSSRHAMKNQPERQRRKGGRRSITKHSPSFVSMKERSNKNISPDQYEKIFGVFPDGVIVCDQEGRIVYINAAALRLFEISVEAVCRGADYQQFLQRYEIDEQLNRPISSTSWFTSLLLEGRAPENLQCPILALALPSGRKVYVYLTFSPMLDSQKQILGTISLFHEMTHRYEKALHLQRVHQAVAMLTEAITRIPMQQDLALPEETPLLSPPAIFVAQQLVDVIYQVLECPRVWLSALGPLTGRSYYVAGSGLTPEQEEYQLRWSGYYALSAYIDDSAIADLNLNREVIISTDQVRCPPKIWRDFGEETILGVPLFLEQRLAGVLVVVKQGSNAIYTPEEIELVRAVAAQTVLVIDCLGCLLEQTEKRATTLVLNEMHRLSNEFLTLAGHELRTPLTGIVGNIQVAQRRLERVKRQVSAQPENMNYYIAYAQEPLALASQSARVQQRMISAMIDDARIQANALPLYRKRVDLPGLLKESIAEQRKFAPQSTIVLETRTTSNEVAVIADTERIKQVLATYLETALRSSPEDRPVAVRLMVENNEARVSVHDEGAGIAYEEQAHLWDRFYRARGSAVQQELDLSLGLGFYLCRVLIELHQGRVGVQSSPEQGATFWFTLPLAPPVAAG